MSGTSPASAGTSRVSPGRVTRGRRCSCVAGSAAAERSASTRSSASACRRVTPGASLPMTLIAPPRERFVRGSERQRRPRLVVDRVPETLRHHADHGRRLVPQRHDRSDDVAAAAEETLPHVVAKHDHAGCARPLVGVQQATSEQGRHPRRTERGGGEIRRPDRLGSRVAGDEIAGVRAVRAQVVDRADLAPPCEEVAHDASLGLVRQGVPCLDQDEPLAFGQRNRRRQEFARQVVPARPDADRNGQRQSARERQARVLQQHSQSEPVIL